MKTRLSFGFPTQQGDFGYSSEHWLEGYELDGYLPIGSFLRFDVPLQDEDGRWAVTREGAHTGGDSVIRAKIVYYEGFTCSTTQDHLGFVEVVLEVAANNGDESDVKKLLQYFKYRQDLKAAEKIVVRSHESGFSQEQSYYLQAKDCVTVADVAKLLKSSFHKDDTEPPQIEQILKQKWGLMFGAGHGWYSYTGPAET